MRLLVRPRPHVHILEVIVLALEGERARLGPRLHHEVVRLLEALVRVGRVGAHRVVFGADAAHHAGDQPAAGDAVDHGVLFGDVERMLAQAERIAEDRDLGVLGAPRQRRRGNDRRGHQAVGVLVMLVHRDAVEAELGRHFELVEIAVVELVAFLRIEVRVRQHHPGGAVLVLEAHVQIGIGHQVEDEDPHRAALRMNCETSRANACGCSMCGRCAQSAKVATLEPAMPCLEGVGVGQRDHLVLLAPDNVGRHVDPVQPAVELRIAQPRRPGVARGRAAVAIVDVLQVGGGAPRLQPRLGAVAGEQQLQQFVLGADEHVGARHALDAKAGAVHQHQRLDAFGRADRHLDGEPAADALADDVDAVEL